MQQTIVSYYSRSQQIPLFLRDLITSKFQFSKYCAYLLKFLTSTTHVIYRILTLYGTIIIGNKILFKFEDNKKQIFF